MLNATSLLVDALVERLKQAYLATFSNLEPSYPGIIEWVARMALERIANSDALYHDVEHTALVTLVGQEILRGRHIVVGGVTPRDWLHFTVALLCHDIGYVRGVCAGDDGRSFVIDDAGQRVTPPRGASDAFLTPYHVNRGRLFVQQRLGKVASLDAERVVQAIELTRFPVPGDGDHLDTDTEPGLVRAADLIGQLADPDYMRKINRLYVEFAETGTAAKLGYASPADLAEGYHVFFWSAVRSYIDPALRYLQVTQEGKQWVANLFAHVFASEHGEVRLGPCRG